MIAERVARLINRFSDRIPDWRLESMLDYLSHNENGIALEYLDDYLHENDITPVPVERAEIDSLREMMGLAKRQA
jgi:hypothetical protein